MSDDDTIVLPFEGVSFNADAKFDLQLSQALINERRLAAIFATARIERVELKSESWLWERTGNIAIEYRDAGRPSGIAITQADWWVHELKRNGQTLLYLMFEVARLKQLCRAAYLAGRVRRGGDDGRMELVLLKLTDLLK